MRIRNLLLLAILTCALSLPALASRFFTAHLTGSQETPPNASPAAGNATFFLDDTGDSLHFNLAWSGLTGTFTATHIHHAPPGVPGAIVFSLVPFVQGNTAIGAWAIPESSKTDLRAGNLYVNVHSSVFPAGEIRGQILSGADTAQFENDEVGRGYCIHLQSDTSAPSVIRLIGVRSGQRPVVTIRLGCLFNGTPCDTVNDEGGGIDTSCTPATQFVLSPDWVFADSVFTRTITGDGCVCVTLDQILPVEFGRLTAEVEGNSVALNWNTASESNLNYFEVSRNVVGHDQAILLGRVNASNTPTGSTYRYLDEHAIAGVTYRYTLSVVDMSGASTTLASVNATPGGSATEVTSYALYPNYPNPFNPSTQINFDLKENGTVMLTVYDLLGRHVADLVNAAMAAGHHSVAFAGASLPSGVYVYRLEVNGFTDQKKMVLLK
ncbi:MAG TPA: CHRD domain-containing protein [bacterium]|jgi:hypothetical protein